MALTADTARRLATRAMSQPDTLGDADCEQLHDGLVGQPVNTLTSMGYVAVGLWLLERTRRMPRVGRNTARWYGAFVALTGAGSVAYHGPQFTGAQLFHDLPVVGVIGIGVAVPVARRIRGVPVLAADSTSRALAAGGFGILGALAYVGGRTTSPVCDADSLLQLHGLWHLSTAAAAGFWAAALWPATDSADGASRRRG